MSTKAKREVDDVEESDFYEDAPGKEDRTPGGEAEITIFSYFAEKGVKPEDYNAEGNEAERKRYANYLKTYKKP